MPFSKFLDTAFERKVLENADQIIVVSNSIKKLFEKKIDSKYADKIKIIPNGYDEDDLKRIVTNKKLDKTEWEITYVGNLSNSYPGDAFLDVFNEIVKNTENIKIKFKFIGVYPLHLREKIDKLQLTKHIEFINYIPHNEVFKHLLSADTLFLAIPSTKNNEGILTGKLFEYLAAKKPILCIGPPNGDAAAIITKCNSGKTFSPDDRNDMVKYLHQLISNKKLGICNQFNDEEIMKYSREYLTKVLIDSIKT